MFIDWYVSIASLLFYEHPIALTQMNLLPRLSVGLNYT